MWGYSAHRLSHDYKRWSEPLAETLATGVEKGRFSTNDQQARVTVKAYESAPVVARPFRSVGCGGMILASLPCEGRAVIDS